MVSLAALRSASRATVATRPKLRLIDQRTIRSAARRRLLYLGLCFVLVAGLFAVALVQAQLVQGQQQLDELRTGRDIAVAERARLQRQVDIASSPDAIVSQALDLGMVRAADPVYFTAIRATVNE